MFFKFLCAFLISIQFFGQSTATDSKSKTEAEILFTPSDLTQIMGGIGTDRLENQSQLKKFKTQIEPLLKVRSEVAPFYMIEAVLDIYTRSLLSKHSDFQRTILGEIRDLFNIFPRLLSVETLTYSKIISLMREKGMTPFQGYVTKKIIMEQSQRVPLEELEDEFFAIATAIFSRVDSGSVYCDLSEDLENEFNRRWELGNPSPYLSLAKTQLLFDKRKNLAPQEFEQVLVNGIQRAGEELPLFYGSLIFSFLDQKSTSSPETKEILEKAQSQLEKRNAAGLFYARAFSYHTEKNRSKAEQVGRDYLKAAASGHPLALFSLAGNSFPKMSFQTDDQIVLFTLAYRKGVLEAAEPLVKYEIGFPSDRAAFPYPLRHRLMYFLLCSEKYGSSEEKKRFMDLMLRKIHKYAPHSNPSENSLRNSCLAALILAAKNVQVGDRDFARSLTPLEINGIIGFLPQNPEDYIGREHQSLMDPITVILNAADVICYPGFYGEGQKPDYALGVKYYKHAGALKGPSNWVDSDPKSRMDPHILAGWYLLDKEGAFGIRNIPEAIRCLQAGLMRKVLGAYQLLFDVYLDEKNIYGTRDVKKAIVVCNLAGSLGYSEAYRDAAELYGDEKVDGKEQYGTRDIPKAIECLKNASLMFDLQGVVGLQDAYMRYRSSESEQERGYAELSRNALAEIVNRKPSSETPTATETLFIANVKSIDLLIQFLAGVENKNLSMAFESLDVCAKSNNSSSVTFLVDSLSAMENRDVERTPVMQDIFTHCLNYIKERDTCCVGFEACLKFARTEDEMSLVCDEVLSTLDSKDSPNSDFYGCMLMVVSKYNKKHGKLSPELYDVLGKLKECYVNLQNKLSGKGKKKKSGQKKPFGEEKKKQSEQEKSDLKCQLSAIKSEIEIIDGLLKDAPKQQKDKKSGKKAEETKTLVTPTQPVAVAEPQQTEVKKEADSLPVVVAESSSPVSSTPSSGVVSGEKEKSEETRGSKKLSRMASNSKYASEKKREEARHERNLSKVYRGDSKTARTISKRTTQDLSLSFTPINKDVLAVYNGLCWDKPFRDMLTDIRENPFEREKKGKGKPKVLSNYSYIDENGSEHNVYSRRITKSDRLVYVPIRQEDNSVQILILSCADHYRKVPKIIFKK